ncbi:MAG TPA: hypothetical protein VGQ57_08205 [Polyangiaceae bacterium]|nr:hypothetical protein [Polyangiaceae bacterium]
MTANGSAGKPGDGFQRWVQSLQRPPGAATPGEPPKAKDVTAPLVDENATHVHQIPKELIHRLRERETQGLLGVEAERTAVFRPPPELLERAKRMKPQGKPAPSETPPEGRAEAPTAPPPPEAAVPTVRPPPSLTTPAEDDWSALVETGLDALKPIERVSSNPRAPGSPSMSAEPKTGVRPAVPSAAFGTSVKPPSQRTVTAPPRSSPHTAAPQAAPASSRSDVAVARTVEVGKNAASKPSLEMPDDSIDDPTMVRPLRGHEAAELLSIRAAARAGAVDASARAAAPTIVDDDVEPTERRAAGTASVDEDVEPTGRRAAGSPAEPQAASLRPLAIPARTQLTPPMPFSVQPHPLATAPRSAPNAAPPAPLAHLEPEEDATTPELEPNLSLPPEAASGPRWVLIAAAFLAAVAAVLIALARR